MHFKIVFPLKASTLCARFRGTDGKLLAVGMEDGAVSVVEVATKVDKPRAASFSVRELERLRSTKVVSRNF